jgi:hypothetical protein
MAVPGTFTSGQVLTAAEMNALPGGVIASDSNTTDVSLTTSNQDITSVTVDVVTGRSYGIFFTCRNMSVDQSNTTIYFDLAIEGAFTVTSFRKFLSTTTDRDSLTMAYYAEPASSETRTYDVRASTSTGTGTLFGASYDLQMWVVDLGDTP